MMEKEAMQQIEQLNTSPEVPQRNNLTKRTLAIVVGIVALLVLGFGLFQYFQADNQTPISLPKNTSTNRQSGNEQNGDNQNGSDQIPQDVIVTPGNQDKDLVPPEQLPVE